MFTIYLIEDHRMKLYVGMTSWTAEERFQEHKAKARGGTETHLYRAMRKYGADKFEVIPLDTATSEKQAFELEKKWIECLGTYKDWGYNMTPGGEGTGSGNDNPLGGITGEDHPLFERDIPQSEREKMSEAKRGEKNKQSKINAGQAAEIKWLAHNSNFYQREIAKKKYGISRAAVADIKLNRNWKHITAQKPNK